MSSDMPLVAPAARSSDPVVVASDPVMPSQPFFSSTKQSEWITTSTAPPAGAWQLAPRGIVNPFALGGDRLYGDAVYSTKDRKMTSGNGPVVITVVPDLVYDPNAREASTSDAFLAAGTLCQVRMIAGERLVVYACPADPEDAAEFIKPLEDDDDQETVVGVVAADTMWEAENERDGGSSVAIPLIVHGMADLRIENFPPDEWGEDQCRAGMLKEVCGRCVTVMRPSSMKGVSLVQVYFH